MAHVDVRLSQLLRVYIDGLPLDLVSRLLPAQTRLNFGLLTHIHMHAGAEKQFAGRAVVQAKMSRTALQGLMETGWDALVELL